MKTKLLICSLLSLAWSSSAASLPPADSFRLTVKEIVNSDHCRILTLKIEARAPAEMMNLEFLEGRGGGSCMLSTTLKGKGREGELIMAAMRTDRESPLETTTVLQSAVGGSHASLAMSYDLPADAKVAEIFSLTVTNGVYDLNRPLMIGKRNGEPIRLVVGRWNWEKLAQRK